jgi:hypothetical protein
VCAGNRTVGSNPTLSATDFRRRKSPSKSGISRTAGLLQWSTMVEHHGAQIAMIEDAGQR